MLLTLKQGVSFARIGDNTEIEISMGDNLGKKKWCYRIIFSKSIELEIQFLCLRPFQRQKSRGKFLILCLKEDKSMGDVYTYLA